jgi:hypothetical protein
MQVTEFKFTDTQAGEDTPGVQIAKQAIQISEGRAHWGTTEHGQSMGANGERARPAAGWTPASRAIYRAMTASFQCDMPIYQEQIVKVLCAMVNGQGIPLFKSRQQAENKLQDMLAAPYYPIVRCDNETARATRVVIRHPLMSEDMIADLGKHASRDAATDPLNLVKVDLPCIDV